MSQLLRIVTSYGTVLGAVVMLIYGGYLIRKNSPKPAEFEIQFMPPVSPDSTVPSVAKPASTARRFIGGVGIIEPVGEAITIGSQLAGIVSKVLVSPGDNVREGDALLQLDDRTARANVDVARSQLAAEQSRLNELLGQIAPQRSRVDAAQAQTKIALATLRNATSEMKRAEALAPNNAISGEELDQRRLSVAVAEAQSNEAEARYREALANLALLAGEPNAPTIDVQKGAIEQARAALAREEVTLALHTIRAPKDSTVLQVKVRAGEFVPAAVLSVPLVTLGVIDPYHVRVDIDETDIPRFHSDAKAFASVRGRPDVRVPMSYVRTEPYVIPKKTLNGSVSERVDTRVLQIIYAVEPSAIQASPGQQVDVYIEETPPTTSNVQ